MVAQQPDVTGFSNEHIFSLFFFTILLDKKKKKKQISKHLYDVLQDGLKENDSKVTQKNTIHMSDNRSI